MYEERHQSRIIVRVARSENIKKAKSSKMKKNKKRHKCVQKIVKMTRFKVRIL